LLIILAVAVSRVSTASDVLTRASISVPGPVAMEVCRFTAIYHEGVENMCYDCGCGKPNEEHGTPDHITEKDFEKAAKANGKSVQEAKKHTLELLQKQLSIK
jgi:hypothetical protein